MCFPAGILRNPAVPFFKLLERNCDFAPAGKLPGARSKNRSVWSSVEIDVGFKNKYASYFFPNISRLQFNIIKMVCGHPFLFQHRQQSIRHRNRIQAIIAAASHLTLPITHTHIACDSSYCQLLISCSCSSPHNNSASIFCWQQSATHNPSNQYEC